MRSFISIDIDRAAREQIAGAMEFLKSSQADVRWVSPVNLHVTLKFLGEIRENFLLEIKDSLSLLASRQKGFVVRLYGIGVFPTEMKPRIIWVGMDESSRLKNLQEEVEASMASLGFEKEKREFSPHLTIGRVKSLKGKDLLIERIETLKNRYFGNIEVNNFSLMKSVLKPAGAQYETLAEFNFN